MIQLRTLLILLFAGMMLYTSAVIATHGPNFLHVFLADIASLTWRGQFNLDFAGYLLLSALWIVWRNGFTPSGWALGAIAGILGMPVFSAYLIYLLVKTDGDLIQVLLGVQCRRAA